MIGLVEAMHPTSDNIDVMMSIGNVNTTVVADDAIIKDLESYLSYRVDDAEHIREGMIAKSKRLGRKDKVMYWMKWNGKFSCLKNELRFGTGLLQDVIMWCHDKGFEVNLIDHTTGRQTGVDIEWKKEKIPFDNQADALRIIEEHDYRGILHASVAYGKTVVGTHIIQKLGVPTIILVDRTLVMKRWREEFAEVFNFEEEKLKGGAEAFVYYHEGEPLMLLCTTKLIKSASEKNKLSPRNKLIQWFTKEANLVIYDEVHRAGAKQKQYTTAMIKAYHRVGLSGTVGTREDKADYEYYALISPTVYYYSVDELIESGKGAQIYIEPVVMPYGDLSTYRRIDNFDRLVDEYIVTNRERNLEIARVIFDQIVEGKKILVLVDRVKHGQILQNMLGDKDVVTTDASDKDKMEKFRRFTSGEVAVMICTYSLGGEGFDYPELNTLVLAGGKSKNKIEQAVGRIVRVKEDGGSATVFDIVDPINPFKDHFVSRLQIYVNNKSYIINKKELPRWSRVYL